MEALIRSLPDRADQIRRLFWHDPEFRAVCEDYRDALAAAAKFELTCPANPGRAEEYRQLAADLLAEAVKMLEKARS
jgi:hypothetical protein